MSLVQTQTRKCLHVRSCSFISDCLLHHMLQLNQSLLQFVGIMDPLLMADGSWFSGSSHSASNLDYQAATNLARQMHSEVSHAT